MTENTDVQSNILELAVAHPAFDIIISRNNRIKFTMHVDETIFSDEAFHWFDQNKIPFPKMEYKFREFRYIVDGIRFIFDSENDLMFFKMRWM